MSTRLTYHQAPEHPDHRLMLSNRGAWQLLLLAGEQPSWEGSLPLDRAEKAWRRASRRKDDLGDLARRALKLCENARAAGAAEILWD